MNKVTKVSDSQKDIKLLITPKGELIEKTSDLNDVIGEMPQWIFRAGMLSLLGIVFLVVLGAWFFKYEDTVSVNCLISTSELRGHAKLKISDYSKVKNGKKAVIKFFSFPYDQYGTLTGKVISDAQAENDSLITVNIALPISLTTSSHRQLPNGVLLYGSAEIYGPEKSLFSRLLEKVTKRKDWQQ